MFLFSQRFLQKVILCWVIILFSLFLLSLFCILFSSYGNYSEAIVLFVSQHLSFGETLYGPLSANQYTVIPINYGPLYFLLISFFGTLFKFSYLVMRTVDLFLFFGCLLLAVKISLRYFGHSKAALLTSIFLLIPSPIFSQVIFGHVDILAVFFDMAGIFILSAPQVSVRRCMIAALFFVLAWLTKPIVITGCIAACAFLLFQKKWKHTEVLAGTFLLGVLFSIVILQQLTNGYFLQHLVYTGIGSFVNLSIFSVFLLTGVVFYGFVYGAGALMLKEIGFRHLLSLFFLSSLLLIVALIRVGGSSHYFFESYLVATVLAGEFIYRKRNSLHLLFRGILRPVLFFTFLISGTIITPLAHVTQQVYGFFSEELTEPVLRAELSQYDDSVLFENFGYAPVDGKNYRPFEFFVYNQLANGGVWNISSLTTDIYQKKFSALVLESDILRTDFESSTEAMLYHFHPQVKEAILESYVLKKEIPPDGRYLWIFEPR